MPDTNEINLDAWFEYKFWNFVDKRGEDECWRWKGYKNKAFYGRMRHQGRNFYAHRVSYELNTGHVEKGALVLHKCNNPSCVNPKHLYKGTQIDNMKDRSKTNQHTRGNNHPMAILTENDVVEIRKLLRRGTTHRNISKQFGVERMTITHISVGDTWRHVI